MRKHCAAAIATLIATLAMSQSAQSKDTFAPRAIGAEFFGMHVHWNDTSRRVALPSIGSLRLWDTRTNWSNLEPKRGQWDFSKLDKHIALATTNNLEIVMTLGSTPRWASLRPDQEGPYGPGTGAPPKDLRDWDNYVRTLAKRYRGKIAFYEVLNEPTFLEDEKTCETRRHFWCGSAAEMVDLVRHTREVVKGVDPDARIVSPGFTGATSGREDHFFDAGGGAYVDVIAHHFYAVKPEQMMERIALVKKSMIEHGYGHLELWNTESGYVHADVYSQTGGSVTYTSYLNDEMMAAYVAQSLILSAAAGVRRFFWYAWDNPSTGMAVADGSSPLPGGLAYNRVAKWLLGGTVSKCQKQGRSLFTCTLEKGGRVARLVWSARPAERIAISGDWGIVARETLDGRVVPLSESGEVEVGPQPILLVPSGFGD